MVTGCCGETRLTVDCGKIPTSPLAAAFGTSATESYGADWAIAGNAVVLLDSE